jgi:predicted dienelactone hydrolase
MAARVLFGAVALLSTLSLRAHAQGSASFASVEFRYEHKRYMFSREEPGAVAHVAGGAPGETLPLVIFLHGMNPDRDVHLWMGGGPGNLRDHVDAWVRKGEIAPLVLAAPSHTRYALAGNVMWPDFDLDAFVDATEAALNGRAHVDRDRVVLVGHSGAGCNAQGGIFSRDVMRSSRARLQAVVAIDTCVDDDVLPAFQELARNTRLYFYWQPAWARPVDDLTRICDAPAATCSVEEIPGLHGNPHNTVLPVALERALSQLLPQARSPR